MAKKSRGSETELPAQEWCTVTKYLILAACTISTSAPHKSSPIHHDWKNPALTPKHSTSNPANTTHTSTHAKLSCAHTCGLWVLVVCRPMARARAAVV